MIRKGLTGKLKRILMGGGAVLLVGLLLPTLGISAAAPGVEVSVNAPAEVGPDQYFDAQIDISEVTNFDAADFKVVFDPTVLAIEDIPLPGDITDGQIDGTTIPVVSVNEMTAGTVKIVVNVPGMSGVNGTGYLCEIRFHAIGAVGTSSNIILQNGTLSGTDGHEVYPIAANWTGTTVSIVLPDISVDPAAIDFGEVTQDTCSAPETVTVSNDGSGGLVIDQITITGADANQFDIQNDNVSWQTLYDGASDTLEVLFCPTSAGTKTADLEIPSNDPDEPLVTVPLSGTTGVTYTLTVDAGPCGWISSPGEGTFGPYDSGDTQWLYAIPDVCCMFVRWEGDIHYILDRYDPDTYITMYGNYDITAVFTHVQQGVSPATVEETLWPEECITIEKRVGICMEDLDMGDEGLGTSVTTARVRLEVVKDRFKDWVEFDPAFRTWSLPSDVVYFEETICPPRKTQPGTYKFDIRAVAYSDYEELLIGKQEVEITVPKEISPVSKEGPNLAAAYILILPDTVVPNQEVEISINIGNDGGTTGTRSIGLYINGELRQSQTVSVSPGASKLVVFRVTESEPGVYQVLLEGNEGQFTVISQAKARYLPGPLGTPGIIVIVVVAVVLIGAILFVFLRRE